MKKMRKKGKMKENKIKKYIQSKKKDEISRVSLYCSRSFESEFVSV